MNDLIPVTEAPKQQKKGFKTGNPGKPKGARNKATVMAEKLLSRDIKKIVSVVQAAAMEGDMVACRLVLERLIPAPKGRRLQFNMPTGLGLSGIAVAFDAIMAAVGQGAITTDEATALAAILEKQAKILEVSDTQRRLDAIENKVMAQHETKAIEHVR
jgi:hypothetical protein